MSRRLTALVLDPSLWLDIVASRGLELWFSCLLALDLGLTRWSHGLVAVYGCLMPRPLVVDLGSWVCSLEPYFVTLGYWFESL